MKLIAKTDLTLDSGRKVRAGEVFTVSPPDSLPLIESGQAEPPVDHRGRPDLLLGKGE